MIYEPSDDSYLLESCISKYVKGKSFLDIGSGSGILAEAARKAGAKSILASDIQDDSIKELKKKKINAIKSDLFNNIKGKFDVIAFNPPYLPFDSREDKDSRTITTGGKKGDEVILRFLKETFKHINKNGVILILLSSLTPRARILSFLKKSKMSHKVIASKKLFFESLEVFEIRLEN